MFGPFAVVKNTDIPEGVHLLKGEVEQIVLNFELINKCNHEMIIDVGFVDDLDALPLPSTEFAANVKSRVAFLPGTVMPILAKRGCPYSCSYYCTYPLQQGKKFRKHSVKYVVDLIKHCKSNNIHSFIFRDPVFTIDKNWVRQFCHEICRQKIKIRFGAEFHLKDLDDDLIILLAKAGLRICYVGIESQSEANLKDVKRQSVDHDTQKSNIQKLEKQVSYARQCSYSDYQRTHQRALLKRLTMHDTLTHHSRNFPCLHPIQEHKLTTTLMSAFQNLKILRNGI
jgi:radical SAM superfamily enzyme YgiQ (UPF0313 family)